MGNKNNNLEDFLRRKFSDLENSEEAWTKPSLAVKKDVLDKIIEAPNKRRKKVFFILLILGIVASCGLFEYFKEKPVEKENFLYAKKIRTDVKSLEVLSEDKDVDSFTKNSVKNGSKNIDLVEELSNDGLLEQNVLLRQIVEKQNDIISQLKKENLTTQKKVAQGKAARTTVIEKESKEVFKTLLETKNQLKVEQNKLKFLNKTQEEEIELLKNEKELLLNRLNAPIYASNSKQETDEIVTKNKIAFETIKPLITKELERKETLVDLVNLEEGFDLDKPKKKIEFEIGYQFGIRGRMTEVIEYIERQEVITNQATNKFLVSHVHGLNVGVAPLKNFWIKTGAHVGSMNLHQKHSVKFVYNANTTPTVTLIAYADGINDLSRTGVNLLDENIEGLANTQSIVNGDELDLTFQTNLMLTYLQIPLEFNYIYGKKRLKALFQLGGQWNLLNYKYYMNAFDIETNNQNNTSADIKNKEKSDAFSVQYFGLHAGLGLNYNISKHLVFQGLFSYEYYFQYNPLGQGLYHNVNNYQAAVGAKVAGHLSNMGFGVKFGLNYRF